MSCQDIVLDNLDGMTALIGRNSSGKTNILKAIQWAANCATSNQPIEYTINERLDTQIIKGSEFVDFKIEKHNQLFKQNQHSDPLIWEFFVKPWRFLISGQLYS